MSDERLGGLAVLNVNSGRTSDLDLDAVVTRFGQSGQRRIELFSYFDHNFEIILEYQLSI